MPLTKKTAKKNCNNKYINRHKLDKKKTLNN